MVHQVRYKIGDTELVLETGRMAKQANGAVFATMGGSAVLATVCCGDKEVEGLDYVPLSVEYNEKFYAAGKIPGGFLKREARPRDKEILVSRLIDRPMRPLFSKKLKRELQIVPTVVSTDQVNTPDVIAMIAASAAVVVSDIPFNGPVGAVRVCSVKGELVVNPTFEQVAQAELEIMVAGTTDGITMVEGGGKEVPEEMLLAAIEKARAPIAELCAIQLELQKLAGRTKLPIPVVDEAVFPGRDEIRSFARPRMETACFVKGKMNRAQAINLVKHEAETKFKDQITDSTKKHFEMLMEELESDIVRSSILKHGVRTDGRGPEDIRSISCELDVLQRTHGSSLFTRGETQALAVVTLGTVFDEQKMDDIEGDRREKFLLHYNFPPFSVGETGRLSTGRREIGHGHLAYRAIESILPEKSAFPYTIRIVSEVLESNGSSSMATVCGGTLALMNAGVPIKKPVAGIAMGLISSPDRTVVLSDILGEEDHLGDMDFKVAGSETGITGFQMDIKISGVSTAIMKTALEQARRGRLHILKIMQAAISSPRKELSVYAPRILTFTVDQEKIGALIGPGGKVIKGVTEKYGVEVNIENDGTVTIYGKVSESAQAAKAHFQSMLQEPEIGKVYPGLVRRIMDFGAFIEFLPGKEGLCHISRMAPRRINAVSDVLSMNQEVPVKIIEIDKLGRVNLSLIYDQPAGGNETRPRN
jgi:polyribonucleotide nucleotidyltransferase